MIIYIYIYIYICIYIYIYIYKIRINLELKPTNNLIKLVPLYRFITLPNNSFTHSIINNLNKINITTSLPSKTILELVHSSSPRNIFSDAGVYYIPCMDCKLKCIGETSQNLHVHLKEHKRDIRIGNLKNALFQHISQSNHNFDFSYAKTLIFIQNKRIRRIFEAAFISLSNSLNTRPGFYTIPPYWSKSILSSYTILHL